MATTLDEIVQPLRLKPDKASWDKGTALISGLRRAVAGAVAGFVSFKAVQGIAHAVEDTVELGSALNDTAQKTGLSVEALQRLGYVAKLNGSSMEGVASATTKFSRSLVEAQSGSKEAIAGFRKLGISVNSKEFKSLTLEQQLERVAQRLSKMPDGAKKTALAMTLLGKSGADMIPTLNDLGKNGAELTKQFEELGGGLSSEQTAQLDAFGDSVDQTKMQLGNLKNQVVAGLIPTLQEGVKGLQAWIAENRELIKSGIQKAVQGLIAVFKVLGKVIAAVFKFVDEHHEEIAAVFQTVVDILSAAVDIVKFLIKTIVGLVKGIIAGFQRAWNFIKTVAAGIKSAFLAVVDAIKRAFSAAWEFIGNLPVIKQLRELIAAIIDLKDDPSFKGATYSTKNERRLQDSAEGRLPEMTPQEQEDVFKKLTPEIQQWRQQFLNKQPADAVRPPSGSGATSMIIKGGDVKVDIHGVQDPLALNKQISQGIEDAMNSAYLQAREALS